MLPAPSAPTMASWLDSRIDCKTNDQLVFGTTKVFNKNTCKTASSNCGFKARSGSTTTAAAEELSEAVSTLETRISISLSPLAFGVFAAALMNGYEQIDKNMMPCKTKRCKVKKNIWIFI
jgi:hypothetical protein